MRDGGGGDGGVGDGGLGDGGALQGAVAEVGDGRGGGEVRRRRRRGGGGGGGGGRCVHAERMQGASPEMRSRLAGDEEQGSPEIDGERSAGSPDRGFGDVW